MSDSRWKITETGQIDEASAERLGSSFLLGNGHLGYRGTLEEDGRDRMTATIMSGLYDRVGDGWREPVNLPNACRVQVFISGKSLDARTCRTEEHSQTLDLLHAVHERRTTFVTEDGTALLVRAERFVSLASLPLICLRYTVEARQACAVTVAASIDGEVWDLNGCHLRDVSSAWCGDMISQTGLTAERGAAVAATQHVTCPGAPWTWRQEGRQAIRETRLELAPGQARTLDLHACLHRGETAAGAAAQGRDLCLRASRRGFEKNLEEHCALWQERWEQCAVEIDGDPDAELALRFSMYHLLSIAPAHAENVSIPARGLSGQMYKGAVFWDTEMFMLPFFCHAFPGIARNLLMYRRHTLDGARRKAREYGYRGAFFAWESQDTGDDACTLFNVTDVFTGRPLRTYFRDKQVHISADIVYAFDRYVSLTGDESILTSGGAEVIFECCRFLLTRIHSNGEKDRDEILDVTGPDEYHERVHNNAYTNWMTAHAFEICLNVHARLRETAPSFLESLVRSLDFSADLERVRRARQRLYLPGPDPRTSIIPQFDGYMALEDISPDALLERRLHPHEYLGGGNGLAVPTRVIKQADVVLALSAFPSRCAPEIREANWAFYEPRTEHGSSLSACAYSLVAAGVGRAAEAYRYFMTTATADLAARGRRWVGTLYIGGTHPAANGGAWMAAVRGLCGINCSADAISITPRLPRGWTEVRVPLCLRGRRLRVTVGPRKAAVAWISGDAPQLSVKVGASVAAILSPGGEVTADACP